MGIYLDGVGDVSIPWSEFGWFGLGGVGGGLAQVLEFQFLGRNSVGLDGSVWYGMGRFVYVSIPWSEFGWFGHRGQIGMDEIRDCFNSLVGIRLVWTYV